MAPLKAAQWEHGSSETGQVKRHHDPQENVWHIRQLPHRGGKYERELVKIGVWE